MSFTVQPLQPARPADPATPKSPGRASGPPAGRAAPPAGTGAPAAGFSAGPEPFDAERVATIRKAIESGTYPVLPSRIADAMIAAGLFLRFAK